MSEYSCNIKEEINHITSHSINNLSGSLDDFSILFKKVLGKMEDVTFDGLYTTKIIHEDFLNMKK